MHLSLPPSLPPSLTPSLPPSLPPSLTPSLPSSLYTVVPIISTFPMGTFIQNVSAMPTLSCAAFSMPPVFNVTIFRDGTQLVTAADDSVTYSFPAPLNLTTDNGALFECVVFNEAGVRSSRSFTLIVQGTPRVGGQEGGGEGGTARGGGREGGGGRRKGGGT